MYSAKSLKAEEFISDEEIRETLALSQEIESHVYIMILRPRLRTCLQPRIGDHF